MPTTENAKRSTIYLDAELHKALKIKAVETSSNISELVNDAVRVSLREDLEDLEAFEARNSEPTVSFESMLKKLNLDGRI
ncbi:MAG: CopG family transcriptional regulator [Verrucomicrobiota bacterium]